MPPSAAAYVAVAVLVTAFASFLGFSPERSGGIVFWLLAGGPTVILGAVAGLYAKREELLAEWLTPRWGDFTRAILGAVSLFAAAWAFARVICPMGSPREIWLVSLYGQIGDPRALQAHAPMVAAAIVVIALAEEIVWRGMVTQLLAQRFGSRWAWVWASCLYGLAYVPTLWALSTASGPNPVLVIAALGGGLLWGAMGRTFGTLLPGVLAHALFDWAVIMMFPLWGGRLWG